MAALSARTIRNGLIALLALGFCGCAPRFSVHEVKGEGFAIDGDALLREHDGLAFTYNFWGQAGRPFIAVFNDRPDTVYLDLRGSGVRNEDGDRNFARVLSGTRATSREINVAYQDLLVIPTPLSLVLLPGTWTTFYGRPQNPGPPYGGPKLATESIYVYRFLGSQAPRPARHVFTDRVIDRLTPKPFEEMADGIERADRYYADRSYPSQ